MHISNYKNFRRESISLNEQVSSETDDGLYIVHDGSPELAETYLAELRTKSSESKASSNLNSILTRGAAALSAWQDAWKKREALDQGKLRKDGDWYIGKGAWRINSNKAIRLGMKPSWLTEWEDPLHEEIIESFFPEMLSGDYNDGQYIEDEEYDNVNHELELEPEYAMAESKKLKYINRIYEQNGDEFTLGPPRSSTKDEVNVYTPDMLIDKLVRNYNMRSRKNVMIWGAPGIGKTQIVKQAARKIAAANGVSNLPVMIVTLSQMMPTDLGGVPLLFDASAGGEGTTKMVFPDSMKGKVQQGSTIPGWLPGVQDTEEGILFFDEINRADPDMLAASLTLLLDREAAGGKYNMPAGWRIWAAGNREMDGPVKPLEAAVASRFLGGHVHLVPTISDWIKWARSDKGFFFPEGESKPVKEFYVPNEFFAYIKHTESGKGNPEYFDLEGDPIKTEFNQFYRYDKAKLSAGGEGVSVGFPTPRNWAAAWGTIYDMFLSQDKYQSQLPEDSDRDTRMNGVDALPYLLADKRDSKIAAMELGDVVGKSAADDFMSYVKILARHSDADGTINEKIENIFKDKSTSRVRPLLNIPPVNTSEREKILSLILSAIEGMGSNMKTKQYLNWTAYCLDLVEDRKIDSGEVGSHVKQVHDSSQAISQLAKTVMGDAIKFKRDGGQQYRENALAIRPFITMFQEILHDFKI